MGLTRTLEPRNQEAFRLARGIPALIDALSHGRSAAQLPLVLSLASLAARDSQSQQAICDANGIPTLVRTLSRLATSSPVNVYVFVSFIFFPFFFFFLCALTPVLGWHRHFQRRIARKVGRSLCTWQALLLRRRVRCWKIDPRRDTSSGRHARPRRPAPLCRYRGRDAPRRVGDCCACAQDVMREQYVRSVFYFATCLR